MRDVLATGARWFAEGVGFGRATLVRSVGSAPFQVGSTLLVADDGRLAGSVSAGCVEGAAAEVVHAARRGHYRELVHYGVSDERAGEVGLTCGGEIDILEEPDVLADVLSAATEDRALAIATPLPVGREAPDVDRVHLDERGIRAGSLGDGAADAELADLARDALRAGVSRTIRIGSRDVYVDVIAPTRLVIVGAGEIAVYLVRLAHAIGLRTVVIDARTAFLTRERFPDADELLVGWADDLADRAGIDERAHVVALAHDPKFDDPAIMTALRRGSRYVGALGSRRTHAERLKRLRDADMTEGDLALIHAPVGIDLGGHTPADIALGILAEIVSERNRLGHQRPKRVDEPADGLSAGA
jgi:xanthine dehydrogenase accessory factor